MRSKADYVQSIDGNGKTTIEKRGMAAIMRDGAEYEFDIALQMQSDYGAIVEKSRCKDVAGYVPVIDSDFANKLKAWTESGESERDLLIREIMDLEASLYSLPCLSNLLAAIEAKGGNPEEIFPNRDLDYETSSEKALKTWAQWLRKKKEEE
jgi:hypothetical protein